MKRQNSIFRILILSLLFSLSFNVPLCRGGILLNEEVDPYLPIQPILSWNSGSYIKSIGRIAAEAGAWGFSEIYNFLVRDNLAFISQNSRYTHAGFCITDISNPEKPTIKGYLDISGKIALKGDYIYHLSKDCLSAIDISDPDNPTIISELFFEEAYDEFNINWRFTEICTNEKGAYLYVTVAISYYSTSMLSVIEFNNNTLSILGSVEFEGYTYKPIVNRGDYVYIFTPHGDKNTNPRLNIINIKDPYNPIVSKSINIPDSNEDQLITLTADDQHLYLGLHHIL